MASSNNRESERKWPQRSVASDDTSGIPIDGDTAGIPIDSDTSGIPIDSDTAGIPIDSDTSGIPIDRGWAWATVLGCFGMHILVVGGCKSLGVLIVEINDRFEGVSAKELALVQGVNMTLMMALGLVANLLAERYTTRAVVFCGGLLSCLGFIMTAFINRFWLIYLTYSITCGVGFAFSYSPCIVFVGSHFKQRRSLANGLSLSGSGVGTFLIPNFIRWTLKIYGLPGCCLLLGAIMLHVCACALLFRPHASYRRRRPPDAHTDRGVRFSSQRYDRPAGQDDQNEIVILVNGCSQEDRSYPEKEDYELTHNDSSPIKEKTTNGLPKESLLSEYGDLKVNNATALKLSTHDITALAASTVDLSEDITSKTKTRFFDWSLLTNPVCVIYLCFAFLANFGYPNVFFMLPAHAETNGQDRDTAALLVSIVGITDLLGRLFFGWFSDLRLFDRRYGFSGCALVSGVLSLLIPLLTSSAGLVTYASCYGFAAGGYMTLLAVVLADALGPDKLSSSYGMVLMAFSVSLIPGPSICGQIRDSTGSWSIAFMFVGVMAVVASLFPLMQPCASRLSKNRKQ